MLWGSKVVSFKATFKVIVDSVPVLISRLPSLILLLIFRIFLLVFRVFLSLSYVSFYTAHYAGTMWHTSVSDCKLNFSYHIISYWILQLLLLLLLLVLLQLILRIIITMLLTIVILTVYVPRLRSIRPYNNNDENNELLTQQY